MTDSTPTQPVENGTKLLPTADRVRFGFLITLFGLIVFLVGAKPEWLNLERSLVVGFVQICVFLIGLAVICMGGYIGLGALWGWDEKSIAADIGLRLIATGYVICVFAGMADVFGMTMQANPREPFFGPWQQAGVEAGMIVIAIGLLMLVPFHSLPRRKKQ